MNMVKRRWSGHALRGLVAFLGTMALLQSTQAQEHCKLNTPAFATGQVKVKITCQANADAQTAPYPAGTLYIGVSLYKLQADLAGSVAPFRDMGAEDAAHLPAQEFPGRTATSELVFRIPANAGQTHILVAVWDVKNACSPPGQEGCPAVGYTLGRVSDEQLPIPVDAWPRPACDVSKLRTQGFFQWSFDAELGMEVPDQFETLYRTNDCWTYNQGWPGRGVSFRRWRVAPIPRP